MQTFLCKKTRDAGIKAKQIARAEAAEEKIHVMMLLTEIWGHLLWWWQKREKKNYGLAHFGVVRGTMVLWCSKCLKMIRCMPFGPYSLPSVYLPSALHHLKPPGCNRKVSLF